MSTSRKTKSLKYRDKEKDIKEDDEKKESHVRNKNYNIYTKRIKIIFNNTL